VIEITRSASASLLNPEFDDFLFASIDEDRNGMLLSVLSAMARLDVDPWQEAAKLAGLPGQAATQRLAALIAELPGEPAADLAAGPIAARLIALLPRRAAFTVAWRDTLFGAGTVNSSRPLFYGILILVAFVLGALFVMASRQPATRVHDAHAPVPARLSRRCHCRPPSSDVSSSLEEQETL